MSRGLLNNSAHPLLGLILRRVWQGAFVFEDLAEIAAIHPAATGGHLVKCSASLAGPSPSRSPKTSRAECRS